MKNITNYLQLKAAFLLLAGIIFFSTCAKANIVTWVGGVTTAPNSWTEGNNWNTGAIPLSGDDVFIPATANNPYLNVTTTINSLNITGINTSLTLDGTHTLTVNSYATVSTSSSTIITSKSTIIIKGTLGGGGKIDLNGGGVAQIGGDLSIGTLIAGTSTKSMVLFNGSNQNVTKVYQFNNLQIGTSAATTVNFMADETINVAMSGSGILNCGNHIINLTGDMTVKYFNADSGTVNLTGYLKAQSQVVNGYAFYNLSINNNKTYLSGNTSIAHNLNFISGDILLRSYNLTILPGAILTWNGNQVCDYTSGYVVTCSTGHLTMSASSPLLMFPIGYSILEYNPLTITSTGAHAVFDVRVSDGVTDKFGSPLTNNGVNETWQVVPHSFISAATITPQWTDGTQFDVAQELNPFNHNNAVVYYRKNQVYPSSWAETSAGSLATGNDPWNIISGAVTMQQDSSYYIYVGGAGISALPVTLLSFDAKYEDGHVNLNWVTSSEINNNRFEIERSTDGLEWRTIGIVNGHGTTQAQNNYTAFDGLEGLPAGGTLYYRLKQVDYNGEFEYSMLRTVAFSQTAFAVQLYPNPANVLINLEWMSNNELTQIHIVNINGAIVYENAINGMGAMHQQVSMSTFPAGSYIVQVINGSESTSRIIYKQ